jgi:carbamoyltransferase
MKILGISDMINAGAAVVVDGRVVSAVSEERLNRMKLTVGYPRRAIQTALDVAGMKPQDIDAIAIAQLHGYFYPETQPCPGWLELRPGGSRSGLMKLGSVLSPIVGQLEASRGLYHAAKAFATRKRPAQFREVLRRDFGMSQEARFYDHHFVHACQAYYTSDYDDCLVVTMDGGGDSHSSTVYSGRGGKLEFLKRVDSHDSIGNYYSYITNICGFKTHRHEGKITGLAAHGKPEYLEILRGFIRYENGGMRNVANVAFDAAVTKLKEALPKPFDMANLAASIQALLEEVACAYVAEWLKRTGHTRVAVAGGVFANVKLNQRVAQLPGVEELFVHPPMDDGGLPVGAAFAREHESKPFTRGGSRLPNVYWGPGFTDAEIASAVGASGLKHRKSANIHEDIAELLVKDHVVCRFHGRMEFGPRALGNRTILYQTMDPTVNDWLNKRMKRTEFMPFAPATLADHAERCYIGYEKARDCSRFMTITFDCTPEMKKTSPGVCHLDGTARPQVVDRDTAPDFHGILTAYHRRTGIPSLINTSFNMHEEPIVCTPDEAIRSLKDGNLEYLAIGDWIVESPVTPGVGDRPAGAPGAFGPTTAARV